MSEEIVAGSLTVQNKLSVQDALDVQRDVQIGGNLQINGSGFAFGGLKINGPLTVEEGTNLQGKVGINTSTPYAPLTINGSLGFTNDTAPMMYMFERGTSNPDRPVIAHSPPHQNWGMMYRDQNDSMIFQGSGIPVLAVGLGQKRVGINTDLPTAALDVRGKIRSQNARHIVRASNRVGTKSTSWVNMPNMTITANTQNNPILVLFRSGGVQPSTPYQKARLFFRLLVDGKEKDSSMNELDNSGWEMRDISLQDLQVLSAGRHTFQVQWRVEDAKVQNNVSWGRANTRSLIVVEL